MSNNKHRSPEPLSRSSLEATVGIAVAISLAVFHMMWWMRVPLFAILIFVSVEFFWRAPFMLHYLGKFSKVRKAICCFVGLALLYVGWTNVSDAKRAESFPPAAIEYLKYWGSVDTNWRMQFLPPPSKPIFTGSRGSKVVVDGVKLRGYIGKYHLWAACFHWDGREDILDSPDISHSELFDLRDNDDPIVIPWNDKFFNELLEGKTQNSYFVLLLPKNITKSNFKTIREAIEAGGYVLEDKGGPS